jgi:hypothetical protein
LGKVAGALRNVSALAEHGYIHTKIEVAYLSTVAGLDYEGALLEVHIPLIRCALKIINK